MWRECEREKIFSWWLFLRIIVCVFVVALLFFWQFELLVPVCCSVWWCRVSLCDLRLCTKMLSLLFLLSGYFIFFFFFFRSLFFFLFFRCCSLFTLYFLFCCSSSVLFSCVFCYHSFLLLDVAFFSSSLPPICASVFPTSRHNFSFRLRSGNSKGKCRRVIENSHTGNCEWDETINMPHPQWTHTSRAMNPSNRTT